MPRQTTERADGIAIYHVVYANEDFEKSAAILFELIADAQKRWPGKPRHLYLDIEGHRNPAGGFDRDMYELQSKFMYEVLAQYLTTMHTPLLDAGNKAARIDRPQNNDIPYGLRIHPPEDEGGFDVPPLAEVVPADHEPDGGEFAVCQCGLRIFRLAQEDARWGHLPRMARGCRAALYDVDVKAWGDPATVKRLGRQKARPAGTVVRARHDDDAPERGESTEGEQS